MKNRVQDLALTERERLFGELEQFYARTDEKLRGLPQPCVACGQCCRFATFGHRLYISSLEAAFVLESGEPFEARHLKEDRCPYQRENRCGARGRRMLGCRTFFSRHSREETEQAQRIYEEMLSELKSLYRRFNLDWEYADAQKYFREAAGDAD